MQAKRGVAFNLAAENLLATAENQPGSAAACYGYELGRGGKLPSKATIYRWHERLNNDGMAGLIVSLLLWFEGQRAF